LYVPQPDVLSDGSGDFEDSSDEEHPKIVTPVSTNKSKSFFIR
jgi:hypothetical protein